MEFTSFEWLAMASLQRSPLREYSLWNLARVALRAGSTNCTRAAVTC